MWVTVYARADHVFMYVAGLRWDTWNAAGPGDGSSGIGWHPLIRSAAGFLQDHINGSQAVQNRLFNRDLVSPAFCPAPD